MTIYQSRERNNDPYPYRVRVLDRSDAEHIAAREGERLAGPEWSTFWDSGTEALDYAPRPEYDLPVNPILAYFRETWQGESDILEGAEYMANELRWAGSGGPDFFTQNYTYNDMQHAYRVLCKLAAVYS